LQKTRRVRGGLGQKTRKRWMQERSRDKEVLEAGKSIRPGNARGRKE
jgi:hypothetical protein